MPAGWLASILIHACVGLLIVFGFPWLFASDRDSVAVEIVPVEIVTIAEVTDVSPIAPMEEVEAANEVPPEEIEDEPEPAPEPERPRQRSLASFLDDVTKTKAPTQRPNKGPRGENPRMGAGRSAAETVTLEARAAAVARDHILRNRCWRAPADMPNPDQLAVRMRFRLDARGRVVGRPVPSRSAMGNPELRVAIQRAEHAVLQCDPFPFPNDPALRDHYDLWREMDVNFDFREMSG
jgi:hypothetical protein